MVRRLGFSVATLLLVAVGIAAAPRAQACFMCTPQFGCSLTPTGFLTCTTWYVFGTPVCLASGNCSSWPIGSGLPPDAFPKLMRPIWRPGAATLDIELNVFATLTPCTRGCGVFGPGQTSRVLRGAAVSTSPDAMLGTIAQLRGASISDLPVYATGVSVGPGLVEGAFAGRDGNGFVLRAVRGREGVVISACRIEARALGQPLASETLRPGDLLVVRAWVDEQECLIAVTLPAAVNAGTETEVLKQRRASFLRRGREMTLRGGQSDLRGSPSTFQLVPVELGAAVCR